MMLLVSGATRTVVRYKGNPHIGCLVVPRQGGREPVITPWACDNGAFSGFNEKLFLSMLNRFSSASGCMWTTAPDVVGDYEATFDLFRTWEPRIHALGYPVALVAQDGLTVRCVPWSSIECLFIGGSTDWKLSDHSRTLMREAKTRGKLVHVGRVNTLRRMRWCLDYGADTVDGTKFSRFPDTWIPWADRHLAAMHRQGSFGW